MFYALFVRGHYFFNTGLYMIIVYVSVIWLSVSLFLLDKKLSIYIVMKNGKIVWKLHLGWPYRAYIKTAKNGGFSEELLSENNFEAVLAFFRCYHNGANASEAVQKIDTDQKEYHKCSSCVIIC